MRSGLIALAGLSLSLAPAATALAQEQNPAIGASSPAIDFTGFVALSSELGPVRQAHLLEQSEFLTRAREAGALLLDARSESAFAAGHIEGAVNLPLPDFTDEALAEVIGADRDRPIYIYCNNNFSDDRYPIVTKRVELALNIQTFINLHGYGYTNVWELGGIMPTTAVPWVSAG